MNIRQVLFPDTARTFPGMRWLNITLRTMHLVGIVGLGGAYFYTVSPELWRPYLWLTVFSGAGLIAVSLYASAIWLMQLRGQLILFKLLLLLAMLFWQTPKFELAITVIVISSLIAHAPGNLRYYSLWHGRRLERL